MLITIVNALLPVMVTLLLGYIAGLHHDVDTKAASVLNTIVLSYALPSSLFVGTMLTPRMQVIDDLPLAAALLVGLTVPFVVTYMLARVGFGRGSPESALQAMGMGIPAVPFAGLPILTPVIGPSAAIVVAICGIISVVVIVPITIALLSRSLPDAPGGRPGLFATIRHAIAQPVVAAPLIAMALVLAGARIPHPVLSAFGLFGQATAGLALFASGIVLQAQRPTLSPPVVVSTIGRILLIPLIAFVLLPLAGFGDMMRREVVLALGLPGAAMQIILAVRYHVAERENASYLLFSNVFCIPTLALLIALTG